MADIGPPGSDSGAAASRAVDDAQQRVPGRRVQAARHLALLRRTARGHEDAFAELYDETSHRLYGVIVRVIRSPELAEQVTQDAYVEIWRQAARYSPDHGTVLTWMVGVAHRQAVERVRSDQDEAAEHPTTGRADAEQEVNRVWDAVDRTIDVARVRKGLDTLTDAQQEALTLAYFGGYSYPQVARLLGLSLEVAKARIRDGLIGLRDALGVEV